MRLDELAAALQAHGATDSISVLPAATATDSGDVLVDVTHDSREAGPGTLFCAVRGLTVDGHDFAASAGDRGAPAILAERLLDVDCAQIVVDDVRRAMPHAASIVHGEPSNEIAVVGITGTNGKTTTTQLLADILRFAGKKCEVIGTLVGAHTTPESTVLQRQLRAARDSATDVVAMEVSSHALDQGRVDATAFAVAAFSNLTADHLDYHGDMQTYFEAKARLFDGRAAAEVINVDDPWGAKLAQRRPDAVQLSADQVTIDEESIAGTHFSWRGRQAFVTLPGRMNLANAHMAAEVALLTGLNEDQIVEGLTSAGQVPGRMELVAPVSSTAPTVIVDYSHTPDSIERALATVRRAAPSAQVTIVFGCGGDRDRTKRPMMAAAAEAGADIVFLTNDNPRTEDPMAIIADAQKGFNHPEEARIQADRRLAIAAAIDGSGGGDVVLVAGKGHEKTQTVGSDVLPFDDVQVARDLLEAPRS